MEDQRLEGFSRASHSLHPRWLDTAATVAPRPLVVTAGWHSQQQLLPCNRNGFALLAAVAFNGGDPAALGEDLLDRVHQVLAIKTGFKALGADAARGKTVGAAGHFQAYRSGGAVEGKQPGLGRCPGG